MILTGRTVTGSGGKGCGRAIALRFAAAGAAVVLSDIDVATLLTTDQIAAATLSLATDESLAGRRVVFWWSADEPKIIDWGDRGCRKASPFI